MSEKPKPGSKPLGPFVLRLYGLWVIVQITHLAFGAAVSNWVLLSLISAYLLAPRVRRIRIRADQKGIQVRWDGKSAPRLPEDYNPPSAVLAPPACVHPRAQPVELSTGETVAWVCPDCQEQLPETFRLPSGEEQERLHVPGDGRRHYVMQRLSEPGRSPVIWEVRFCECGNCRR